MTILGASTAAWQRRWSADARCRRGKTTFSGCSRAQVVTSSLLLLVALARAASRAATAFFALIFFADGGMRRSRSWPCANTRWRRDASTITRRSRAQINFYSLEHSGREHFTACVLWCAWRESERGRRAGDVTAVGRCTGSALGKGQRRQPRRVWTRKGARERRAPRR